MRERRACHKRVLEGSVDAWNKYCEKRRVLKSKIREKRKLLHDSNMKNINESYWNKKSEFFLAQLIIIATQRRLITTYIHWFL